MTIKHHECHPPDTACAQKPEGWPDEPRPAQINHTLRRHLHNCEVRVFHQLQISHPTLDGVLRLRAYPFANLGRTWQWRGSALQVRLLINMN
jgi:hypothetical protein